MFNMRKGYSVSAKRKNLGQDISGAAMVEFTAAASVFLLLLFGSVEFANAFYQWNAATKAVQWGARVAAVSDPVASNLKTFTGTENGTLAGVVLTGTAYDCVCNTAGTGGCSGTMPTSAPACTSDATGLAALQRIVYGTSGATGPACPDLSVYAAADRPLHLGMCHLFPRITLQNVEVEYRYTGLGYVGRPGAVKDANGNNLSSGAVPTITVRLHQAATSTTADANAIQFQFVMIGGLMKIFSATFPNFINMPSFATTVTGEDLASVGG